MKRFRKRYAIAALLAFVVATSSYAFANSNTVDTSYAGDGTGTVSGYTVTPVWTLNSTNPAQDPTAKITLSAPGASSAYVRALGTGGPIGTSWTSCTAVGTTPATVWNCTFSGGVNVSAITQLQVAAAG